MIRSDRRSPRFRRSSGVRRRRCANGYVRPIPASAGMTCDRGGRAGLSSEERRRLKELERENRELRRANEILRKASAYLSTFGRQHLHHSPPTTTRWPNPSSGCTRRNSSHGAGRGVTARRWSSSPSTGCTGTTTGACSDPSGMCLRLHSRHTTTTNCMSQRWPPDSCKSPSGFPGAVQSGACVDPLPRPCPDAPDAHATLSRLHFRRR